MKTCKNPGQKCNFDWDEKKQESRCHQDYSDLKIEAYDEKTRLLEIERIGTIPTGCYCAVSPSKPKPKEG